MTTADGQSWTYCHLSYLDPAVTGGVQLAAGTQVGLVGLTGHATGPHLHLQLNPAILVPAAAAVVPALRGRRLPLAGLRPNRLRSCERRRLFAIVATTTAARCRASVVLVHPVVG